MAQNLSPNECKATIKLAEFKTKVKTVLEGYAKYTSQNMILIHRIGFA